MEERTPRKLGGRPIAGRPIWPAAILFASLAFLLLAAGPSPARADRGALQIAGIRGGMTQHQVRSSLGPPRWVSRRNWSGEREWQWHYQGDLTVGFLLFDLHVRRVYRVRTQSPRDEFAGELHVGSKERKLHHVLVGEKCGHQDRYESDPPGYSCEWAGSDVFGCGPRFIFYMRHRHGRIRYIELWGIPRHVLMDGRAGNVLPFQPLERRGCF
jgi:hypothetical protein